MDEAVNSVTWPTQVPPGWHVEWVPTSSEDREEQHHGWLQRGVAMYRRQFISAALNSRTLFKFRLGL